MRSTPGSGDPSPPKPLAQEAVESKLNRLGEPVGKQDQYIAAYGGLLCQEYCPTAKSRSPPAHGRGIPARNARLAHAFLPRRTPQRSSARRTEAPLRSSPIRHADSLHFARMLGREIRTVLEAGHVAEFGSLMHQHWMRKRARCRCMSTSRVDSLYDLARSEARHRRQARGRGRQRLSASAYPESPPPARHHAPRRPKRNGFGFDFDGSVCCSAMRDLTLIPQARP